MNTKENSQEITEQVLTAPATIDFLRMHLEVICGRLAEPLLKQNKLPREDAECHEAFLALAHLLAIEDCLND